MARVEIHGIPLSTYVRTARMACHEKGVEYDLFEAMPHTPELLALNPLGKVPALRHGDVVLFETQAIAHYVDEAFDGPALQPDTAVDRARMEQWISFVNTAAYPVMAARYILQYVFPKGADGQPDRAIIDAALPEMRKLLAILERGYDGRRYLVGDRPTLADLFLAPILFYVGGMPEGADLLGAVPAVKAAQAVMAERPSFAATMPKRPG